jgi:hypothetical protein
MFFLEIYSALDPKKIMVDSVFMKNQRVPTLKTVLLSEWEMRGFRSQLPDVQWIKALLHCVQVALFPFNLP